MKKKFECKNCRKSFEADDQDFVICPHCHSDNVEPAVFHLTPWLGRIVLILVLAGVVAGILWLFGQTGNSATESDKDDIIIPNDSSIIGDSLDYEYDADIPPTIVVSEPEFDGKSYSVFVDASNVPDGIKYYYVRMSHFGNHKVLQKSTDGKFSGIPFCEDDGHSYEFAIMDANVDTLLCIPLEKTGFIRQASVSKRMTIQELQALIDKRDSSLYGAGENDYLAPDYKLKFVGLPADAVNIPQILAEVIDKLVMELWQKVSVTALDYDEMNRICKIELQIVVSDF